MVVPSQLQLQKQTPPPSLGGRTETELDQQRILSRIQYAERMRESNRRREQNLDSIEVLE